VSTEGGEKLNLTKAIQTFKEVLVVKEEPYLPTYEGDLSTFHEQLSILVEEKVPICSFMFGLPSPEVIAKLKENSIVLIRTATTV
jgi:nitronate monooxygenase